MSAGGFNRSAYQGDDLTLIFPCRVQPETLDLVIDGTSNSAPTAPPNQAVSARVSGGRRTFGVTARKVRITFTGTLPDGYKAGQVIALPVMTPSVYAAIAKGQVGEYLGKPIQVVGKTPEYIN